MGTREISRKLEKIEKTTILKKNVTMYWVDQWEALSEEERGEIRHASSEVMVLSWEKKIDIFEGL